MYRVYAELTDREGNVIHKTPMMRCGSLSQARSYTRVWSNGKQMGIYKVNNNDTEYKVG